MKLVKKRKGKPGCCTPGVNVYTGLYETSPFISFGDSRSDYEMARYFAQQGNSSTFVFVGAKSDNFEEDTAVQLLRTEAEYAAGTNEYFEKHQG